MTPKQIKKKIFKEKYWKDEEGLKGKFDKVSSFLFIKKLPDYITFYYMTIFWGKYLEAFRSEGCLNIPTLNIYV